VRETFENVPLRHVIQFLNDFHGITIVFRDYGILATTSADAARMNAPAFPEDLPLGSR
jgi:hypothetical protein